MSLENARQQVAKGLEILDQHAEAEWWQRVHTDYLSISDPFNCVLGQVFADHAHDGGLTSGYIWANDNLPFTATELQFAGFCGNSDATMSELREVWEHRILVLNGLVPA
jgi:hypothetical protein